MADNTQIIAPDIYAQQMQLARQQQFADLLRQQSLTPLGDTQQIGGWAIKKSPLEGIAKLAQALGANYTQKSNDAKSLELGNALMGRRAGAFDMMVGGPAPVQPPSAPADPSVATQAPPPQAAPQSDEIGRLRNAAKAAYLMGDSDLGNKLIENMLTLTNEQKNAYAMGQDMHQLGQLDTAERVKKGTQTFMPNQMNILPSGQKIVAPDFSTGRQGGFDANGQPIMGAINGSDVIAQQAGQQAGATAAATSAAQAPYKFQDVTGRNGASVKLSEQQIKALADRLGVVPIQSEAQKAGAIRAAVGAQTPYQVNLQNGPVLTTEAGAVAGARNGVIPLQGEGAKASEVKRGDFFGSNYSDLQKGAMDANAKISKIDRIGALLDGVNTGKLTPAGTELAAYAQSVGLNIDANLGNKQAAKALSNEIALQLRNPSGGAGMPGAMSDKDREFLISMTPSLGNTPEGNKLLIEGMKKLAQREQDIAKLAREYKGGNLDNGFYQAVQEYANSHPMFEQKQQITHPKYPGFSIAR